MKKAATFVVFAACAVPWACTDVQDPVTAEAPPDALLATAMAPVASPLASAVPHLAGAVQAHGGGHGAVFLEDVNTGSTGIIFFDPFPRYCAVTFSSGAPPGDGSFYRQNPDGTVTLKLSVAGAEIAYTQASSPDRSTLARATPSGIGRASLPSSSPSPV